MEVHSQLRLVAEDGLAALPPDDLEALARACRQECEVSGDVRFLILGDCCTTLDLYWAAGAVRVSNVEELDEMLANLLPAVLDDPDPEVGQVLAAHLREELKLFVAANRAV